MADNNGKPACKYGINCYRQNQVHKDQFSHPSKDDATDHNDDSRSESPSPPAKKLKPSTPPPESDNSDSEHEKQSDNEKESKSEDENKSEAEEKNDSDGDNEDDKIVEIDSSSNGESNSNGDSNSNGASKHSTESTDEPSSTTTKQVGARCSEFLKENFDKGPHAQRPEYRKLLETPADFIKSKFLVKMPPDFFAFWEFCELESKNNAKPETLFSKFGLNLVGPFDVLAKKFHDIEPFEPGDYLRHWRFYYDPPEFQVSNFFLVKNIFFFVIESIFE